MNKFFTIVLINILVATCVLAQPTIEAKPRGAVYSPASNQKLYWIPSDTLIESFEKIFSYYLDTHLKDYVQTHHLQMVTMPEQSRYTRQYIGIFKDGKKFLEVRGACNNPNLEELKNQIFWIKDGGWCFFTATFDPENNKMLDFAFNGEA